MQQAAAHDEQMPNAVGVAQTAIEGEEDDAHGIWHLFVIAGSLLHFVAILFYVL